MYRVCNVHEHQRDRQASGLDSKVRGLLDEGTTRLHMGFRTMTPAPPVEILEGRVVARERGGVEAQIVPSN